jgi:protein phosphatase
MIYQEASLFFEKFTDSISIDSNKVSLGQLKLNLPQIPISFLSPFLKEMKKIFQKESILLELDGSFVIIGDLHGHFLDLCRIFKTF